MDELELISFIDREIETPFGYTLNYDSNGDLILTEDIKEIFDEFNIEANEEILSDYMPMLPNMYHNHKTPSTFRDTHKLSEAANRFIETGKYCEYRRKSRKYKEFWEEEYRRCREGYSINVGTPDQIDITGLHYFFLNYRRMQITVEVDKELGIGKKVDGFPKFWIIHYHFFWALQEEAKNKGKHLSVVKPRRTGFTEVMGSIGVHTYVTDFKKTVIYCGYTKDMISGAKRILDKVCWDTIDFLNINTNGAMLKPHQVVNSPMSKMHRRASKYDKRKNEIWKGSEIQGVALSQEKKVRGLDGLYVMFEEAGSFPTLKNVLSASRPLVEQDGYVIGTLIPWGTGGEDGIGIIGLREMFYTPTANNMVEFINYWDKGRYGKKCGFFFPVQYCIGLYMDDDGNMDTLRGYLHHIKERQKIRASGNETNVTQYAAEYPFSPMEALQRIKGNIFPTKLLEEQLIRIQSEDLDKLWTHGKLERAKSGVTFKPDNNLIPFNDYPVDDRVDNIEGCISILETPKRVVYDYKTINSHGQEHYDKVRKIPKNLYTIVVDPFASDQTDNFTSIGACYVIKEYDRNVPINLYTGTIVAKYIGRPDLKTWWSNVFKLAEYYNCKINFERRGGGQSAIDYAREWKKTHLLEHSLDMLDPKERSRNKNLPLGNTFTDEMNKLGYKYLAEWLMEEVSVVDDTDKNKTVYQYRLNTIMDIGFLKECISFVIDGNFDRISSMRLYMFCHKQFMQNLNNTVEKGVYNDIWENMKQYINNQ